MNLEVPQKRNPAEILDCLSGHHGKQLDLCARLERLADSLPDNFDTQECLALSRQIYPVVRQAHEFEEQTLFPALVTLVSQAANLEQSIERLKFEHWEDETTAEDISTSLRELVLDPASANTEKIAYMLRGFFEGVRRHVAFETDHLLPRIREITAAN